MRTRVRPIFAIAVALAVIAFACMGVMTEQPAYAKGPVHSSSGGGSSSDSSSGSSSSSSNSSSSHSNDSGSSHSSNSGSSHSSNSGSSSGSGSSNMSSGSGSSSRSSSNTRVYQAPTRSSTSTLDQDFYLRTPSTRSDSKRPTPTYRKDYADIGDLWKNRQEKRDTSSSNRSWSSGDSRRDDRYDSRYDGRRDSWYYDRDDRRRDDRGWGISIYTSPFRFHYYCYDYRPTMCYPSPYCYYYDYYPPYIYYDRVVVIARPMRHVFVEIPVFIYKDSSDYYLTNPADKSLWTAIRDVQLAWEHSDSERLMKHVDRRGTIDVYLNDEYTYSVDRFDYSEMTLDAMLVIHTRSIDFDRVTREDTSRYVAHGTHVYTDRYGLLKSVYITYTFERYGGEWYITAVGTSTRPI